MERYDILIIGGGAAGMAAALAAEARGARVILAERSVYLGGILPQCIHHGFGLGYFGEDLTGPEYAARFVERMERTNIDVRLETTVAELREDKTALLVSHRGAEDIAFGGCILCSGSRERTLASRTVAGTRPAGILTAGTAQKLINLAYMDIGDDILIVGSGDIGQIMARRLRILGKRVVAMVEQRGELGGMARNRRDCIEAYDIPVILNATVETVLGAGRVSGAVIRHLDTGEQETLECGTVITALGLIPERELTAGLGEVPWLRCVGNCDYIHEIVDTVSAQAERIAAEFCL